MALHGTSAAFEPAAVESSALRQTIAHYWALTKPEINFLIGIAIVAGFYLGCPAQRNGFPFLLLIHTLLGTLLVASGAGALNQCAERRFDAQMRRTRRRPLLAGSDRLSTGAVCVVTSVLIFFSARL